MVSGVVDITSDRRVKKDIEPIPYEVAKEFLNFQPVSYRLRSEEADRGMPMFGYIAQDVMKNHFGNLLNHFDNDDMKVEEEGDVPGIQYSVDYSRVCTILHTIIKKQNEDINELKNTINSIIEYNPIKKFLQKNSILRDI
jgi:hypothetical protein